jgi:hypothetical protein
MMNLVGMIRKYSHYSYFLEIYLYKTPISVIINNYWQVRYGFARDKG